MIKDKKDGSIKKYVICIIVMVIIIIGLLFVIIKSKKENVVANNDFIYLSDNYQNDTTDNYVIKSYEEYKSKFNNDVLTEEDFKNNNYVIITLQDDTCSSGNVTPTSYTIKNNKINVVAKYEASCGVCSPRNLYYLLKVDKSIIDVKIDIDYVAINTVHCDPDIAYKPIMYVYPEEEMNLKIKLVNDNLITHSYPKYKGEWNVSVNPNGNIYDYKTNRNYYALYWEGSNHNVYVHEDGFVIKGEDTYKFLEEKLEILGLNEKEINEFIIYWLPKMENNKYNYIRFETMDEINDYMPLEISKKPDTLIRVYMDFKPLNKKIKVKMQKLEKVNRKGFTIVEWGGSIIK